MDAGLFQQIYNPLVPVALHGPLLTDQSGLPRYWSTIWSVVSSGQLAASTHTKKLRYIEDLYAHADRLLGKHALDDALGSLNETALAEILESWFVSIRNRSTVTRDRTANSSALNALQSAARPQKRPGRNHSFTAGDYGRMALSDTGPGIG